MAFFAPFVNERLLPLLGTAPNTPDCHREDQTAHSHVLHRIIRREFAQVHNDTRKIHPRSGVLQLSDCGLQIRTTHIEPNRLPPLFTRFLVLQPGDRALPYHIITMGNVLPYCLWSRELVFPCQTRRAATPAHTLNHLCLPCQPGFGRTSRVSQGTRETNTQRIGDRLAKPHQTQRNCA